ncbi:MAG: pyridoxamine 5'-phosphate oxidase family protein [Bacteroidales bacterium]
MIYNNSEVRRQDRLLEESRAIELLKEGEYGYLSMVDEDGTAYGVPINFVWDGNISIYLHCAPQGRKLKCIQGNGAVSFTVVGKTKVASKKFTTAYESIVLKCRAYLGLEKEERLHGLKLFIAKYSPEDQVIGLKYIEKSFHRTEVIRLDIIECSGKTKQVH